MTFDNLSGWVPCITDSKHSTPQSFNKHAEQAWESQPPIEPYVYHSHAASPYKSRGDDSKHALTGILPCDVSDKKLSRTSQIPYQ